MADRPDRSLSFPGQLRDLPADLAGVCLWTVLTLVVVSVPWISETPLRVVLGFVFVLFVPGYAFVAALFPEAAGTDRDGTAEERGRGRSVVAGRGIDGIERTALSFALSIAIVSLVGLALNFSPWGIRPVPIVVSLTTLTLGFVVLAAYRRRQLPSGERLQVPYQEWIVAGRSELFAPDSRTDTALNVLLLLSVLLATASVAYAVMGTRQGDAFTELYLLNEDADGQLVAENYSTTLAVGQSKPLVVGIGNHEHEPMDYTVVIALQRVERDGDATTVLEEQELDRLATSVEANGTWHQRYEAKPTMTGEELRLVFLLYRGEPPADPSVENAYRWNHVFVNVTSSTD
ncbi:DUF1616 domain-containing protein [Halorhabdus rudnickae]|uniref:DUF1616 domain-containing protein n=1 Tax=Halorhabdus rudnickae TaxID=1775544 RepID=UPI001082323A|nr:DUF1616 domain-containing protein [Halorhabdus rudnickae]